MFMQDTWPAVHLTECKRTAGGACSSAGTCTRTRALAHGFTRWAGRPAAQTPACASGQTKAWFQTTSPAPGIRTASARWGPDLERRSMAQSKPRWAPWAQEFWNGSSTFCSKQEQDRLFKGHLLLPAEQRTLWLREEAVIAFWGTARDEQKRKHEDSGSPVAFDLSVPVSSCARGNLG